MLSSVQKVKLLIIDEVHLLNEDRGAVIETIVARTLRLVRSSIMLGLKSKCTDLSYHRSSPASL